MLFQPLASQMKLAAVAHATSCTFWARKCQVSVGEAPDGRIAGVPASALAMIGTVVSECSAAFRRVISPGVRTSVLFSSVPLASTTKARGTVIE